MTNINVSVSATGTDVDELINARIKHEHLIAAAPELYEVLSEAMERGGSIQMCLYDKAISALAKARGEV